MLLKRVSEFGVILFVCYVAEHHPPFPHGEKVSIRSVQYIT